MKPVTIPQVAVYGLGEVGARNVVRAAGNVVDGLNGATVYISDSVPVVLAQYPDFISFRTGDQTKDNAGAAKMMAKQFPFILEDIKAGRFQGTLVPSHRLNILVFAMGGGVGVAIANAFADWLHEQSLPVILVPVSNINGSVVDAENYMKTVANLQNSSNKYKRSTVSMILESAGQFAAIDETCMSAVKTLTTHLSHEVRGLDDADINAALNYGFESGKTVAPLLTLTMTVEGEDNKAAKRASDAYLLTEIVFHKGSDQTCTSTAQWMKPVSLPEMEHNMVRLTTSLNAHIEMYNAASSFVERNTATLKQVSHANVANDFVVNDNGFFL